MKTMDGKAFCRLLESQGWTLKRINGSHHIYAKVGEDALITVPVHGKKHLKIGLQNYLMKIAGIEVS